MGAFADLWKPNFLAKDMLTPLFARQFLPTIQSTKKYPLGITFLMMTFMQDNMYHSTAVELPYLAYSKYHRPRAETWSAHQKEQVIHNLWDDFPLSIHPGIFAPMVPPLITHTKLVSVNIMILAGNAWYCISVFILEKKIQVHKIVAKVA